MEKENQKMEVLMKDSEGFIALNTTKEATVEVMNVETMENQNQKEMREAKEEAVNMFLKFKAMMETKIAEMEITSSDQRRQIEDLEVRLQITENWAYGLRSDLKEMKEEVDKLKNSRVHPLDKPNVKGSAGYNEVSVKKSPTIKLDRWEIGPTLLSPSNRKDTRLLTAIGHCSSVSGNVSIPTAHQGILAVQHNVGNPDQLSMLQRSKEPQLKRSDCTPKVHAGGKTTRAGKLSLPVHADTHSSSKKNKAGNVGPPKKIPTQLKEGNSSDKGEDLIPSEVPSKKRGTATRRSRSTLSPDQIIKSPVGSALSHCQTSPCPENTIANTSGKEASIEIEATTQNSSVSTLAPVPYFSTTIKDAELGSAVYVQTFVKGIKAKGFENVVTGAQVLINESNLTTLNTEDAHTLGTPDLSLNLKKVKVSPMNNDTKNAENSYGMLAETPYDKPLKYTFQRKRKKESLSSPDGSTNLANGSTRKKQGEGQSNCPDPQKSTLMLESSSADQQVVQVARQLISMKVEKWSDQS